MRRPSQSWHTATATKLMNAARGDLILNKRGDLCERITFNITTFTEIPWDHQQPGNAMALIDHNGWTITPCGAQWFLENCPPDNAYDRRALELIASDAVGAVRQPVTHG